MILNVLEKLGDYGKSLDKKKIQRALDFVRDKYAELDKTDSFFLEILEIIFPFRPDEDTIVAALLLLLYIDGFLDDSEVEKLFGQDVLHILIGVKRLHEVDYAEGERVAQMEVLRKMFLAMAKDLRVILLSLARRLYRMRHLEQIIKTEEERAAYGREVLNLYAPIAARLGIYSIKGELEDLAFKYSDPEAYKNVVKQVERLRSTCRLSIAFVKTQLEKFLRSNGIDAKVSGRIKRLYSIHRKLKKYELSSIDDLYDIFAIRVVLPAKEGLDHVYGVLGLIHGEWKPISKKFKDYIAVPKPNAYRSLHTVVLGIAPRDKNQPVEIQIRDTEMHREAEYGVASHWAYKDSPRDEVHGIQSQIEWIKGLEDFREEINSDTEIDIFKDRIFVLTPRGEVKDLPIGACPIDFAYCVHTDIGNKCVTAKVNGRIVSLDYELKNGDAVEIITRKDATPKLQWLSFVKTGFTRQRIKNWFSSLNRDSNIKEGRRLLNNQLLRIGKPTLDQNYSILKSYLGKKTNLAQREGIVEEVGNGGKTPKDIIRNVFPYENFVGKVKILKKRIRKKSVDTIPAEDKVLIGGERGLPIKLAACCKPKVGHNIVGYVTRGNQITVHKSSCKLIDSLDTKRFVFADWNTPDSSDKPMYLVGIKVLTMGRVGLMRDITSVISGLGVNIREVSLRGIKKGMSEEHFLVELADLGQFDTLVDKIENVKGVMKVTRAPVK